MKGLQVSSDIYDVSTWDFDTAVFKTKDMWEQWQGVSLKWRSLTVDLGRAIWTAHKAITQSPDKNKTVAMFIEQVGINKSTFYNFIERIDKVVDSGVNLQELSGDMKLVDVAITKTPTEIELGKRIAEMNSQIKLRDKSIKDGQDTAEKLRDEIKKQILAIEKLKVTLEESSSGVDDDPKLRKRIADLEKKEAELKAGIVWWENTESFRKDLENIIAYSEDMAKLGHKLLAGTKKAGTAHV